MGAVGGIVKKVGGAIGSAVGGPIGGALVGGALGAITGGSGSRSSSNNTSGVILQEAGKLEKDAYGGTQNSYNNLQGIIGYGPSASDYRTGVQSQRDLAGLLSEYQANGGLPTTTDINASNDISNNLYAARRTALSQTFQDQNTEAERLAARLGRPINDPILQAKLRTGFMRQSDALNAEQQGTAQQLALQLPGQRLGYAQQRSSILSGLGDQAIQNQNYLLGIGSNLTNMERQWRFNTGEKYGNQSNQSGGGFSGAVSGAISGAAGGMGLGNALDNYLGGSSSFNLNNLNFAPGTSAMSLNNTFNSFKPSLGITPYQQSPAFAMNPGYTAPSSFTSSPFYSPFTTGVR